LLLLGVQGCGKSLAAKAIAGGFGVPLVRLDFGALYNKYHGETERNLRESLKTAEALSPCVLWCDEIEKGLATSDSDDGVSRRVLGALLTWMANASRGVSGRDRQRRLAAAAGVAAQGPLRRDLLRRPAEAGRAPRDLSRAPRCGSATRHSTVSTWALAAGSDGFSGAEIEQAIVSALYSAFGDKTALTQTRLLDALRSTRPLSVLMAERVAWLRDWARERCVPAD
jgi:SpoVK/Ycf46/Vps4 family AAA+-type ATPase